MINKETLIIKLQMCVAVSSRLGRFHFTVNIYRSVREDGSPGFEVRFTVANQTERNRNLAEVERSVFLARTQNYRWPTRVTAKTWEQREKYWSSETSNSVWLDAELWGRCQLKSDLRQRSTKVSHGSCSSHLIYIDK